MEVFKFLLLFLALHPMAGLILPLTKPNGDPDITSLISHVTLMEQTMDQTIKSLQTQVQTTNSELSTVKGLLQRTEDELTAVKADLKLAEADIVGLKHDLQKSPDPVEFALLKSQVEALKVSHSVLVQQTNLTVLDAVTADVKSNIKDLQSLKSQLLSTKVDVKKTKSEVLDLFGITSNSTNGVKSNKAEITFLKSQVQDMSKTINNTSTDVLSTESRLTTLETCYSSVKSRQNITEQDLTVTKATVQSTAADVKVVKTQLNTLAADVSGFSKAIGMKKNNTNVGVAFQVTQRAINYKHDSSMTLKFNTVDYNAGSGYDNTSGIFTAPVSGTYLLWANVLLFGESVERTTVIYKGGQELSRGYTKLQKVPYAYDVRDASIMTVTHLNYGEQIHFTPGNSSAGWVIGEFASSYGGALLHVA